jgi:DNA-directed RNA polymerase subunit alpha
MHSKDQPLSEEEPSVLNKPVKDLNLSSRPRKCVMKRMGINTLGELSEHSADDLLAQTTFGMTSLKEVREKLAQYGLKLRGDR